jgi:hypothetical protein
MKRQTRWFLFTGALLMALPLFVKPLFTASDQVIDFIKGLGAGIIIAAFFLGLKGLQKTNT